LLRILFIEEAPAVGGSSFSLLQLARGLDRARYDPFALFRYDLPVRMKFEALGIRTATWATIFGRDEQAPSDAPPRELPAYKRTNFYRLLWSAKAYAARQRADSLALGKWIEHESFSLVHANNSASANLGAIVAAARASIPAVSHQRGCFHLTPLHRHLARRVKRFVCVSDAVRKHYLGEGLKAEKVQTIYNGIDVENLKPRAKEKREYVLVGWFGRFELWKGAITFVEAARIILSKRDDVRFLMAGTGPEEQAIRRRVEVDTILAKGIRLLGFRPDALDLIAGCDLFVNSSIEPEPLSRSALEALACGVPVVASDSGGNPEIVAEGENGLLFTPGSSVSLAAALMRLIEDEALRTRCSREGRRRAEALFNAERYVHGVSSLYAEILDGKG
jgi:glycosyltransferase involved in cell wall biosynthesis